MHSLELRRLGGEGERQVDRGREDRERGGTGLFAASEQASLLAEAWGSACASPRQPERTIIPQRRASVGEEAAAGFFEDGCLLIAAASYFR